MLMKVAGPQDSAVPLPAHAEPWSSGNVLVEAEPRPQGCKTYVYFTRNRIHLVLIYLHLNHQMQFCQSHSRLTRWPRGFSA